MGLEKQAYLLSIEVQECKKKKLFISSFVVKGPKLRAFTLSFTSSLARDSQGEHYYEVTLDV